MSLAESLSQIRTRQVNKGPQCSVGRVISLLNESDAAALEIAIADPVIPLSQISIALNDHGHSVKARTLLRHRSRGIAGKDQCACP
jgi:hypothetical protein